MASAAVTLPVAKPKSFVNRLIGGDQVAFAVTWVFASSILLVTAALVWQLWTKSSLARNKFGFSFFASRLWNPVSDQFGALPFIYGTILTSVLALIIAVPLGVGAAIFFPRWRRGVFPTLLPS